MEPSTHSMKSGIRFSSPLAALTSRSFNSFTLALSRLARKSANRFLAASSIAGSMVWRSSSITSSIWRRNYLRFALRKCSYYSKRFVFPRAIWDCRCRWKQYSCERKLCLQRTNPCFQCWDLCSSISWRPRYFKRHFDFQEQRFLD